MNAYEIPNLRFSLPATVAVARRRFVTADSNSGVVYPAANAVVLGVTLNDAAIGKTVTIADGIVMVEAAAAITAGASIATDATGKALTWASGTVIGVAITGATAAGQFVAVKIIV